jgi:hypothetical protein
MWSTIVKADDHQQLPQQIGSPLLAKMVPLRLGEKSPEPVEQVTKLIYDFVRSSEVSYFSGADWGGAEDVSLLMSNQPWGSPK